jgi:hypothetical protein
MIFRSSFFFDFRVDPRAGVLATSGLKVRRLTQYWVLSAKWWFSAFGP